MKPILRSMGAIFAKGCTLGSGAWPLVQLTSTARGTNESEDCQRDATKGARLVVLLGQDDDSSSDDGSGSRRRSSIHALGAARLG